MLLATIGTLLSNASSIVGRGFIEEVAACVGEMEKTKVPHTDCATDSAKNSQRIPEGGGQPQKEFMSNPDPQSATTTLAILGVKSRRSEPVFPGN